VGVHLLFVPIFFQRRFLLLHLLHFSAVGGFLAPHLRHIFTYSLLFLASSSLNSSLSGIPHRFLFVARSQITFTGGNQTAPDVVKPETSTFCRSRKSGYTTKPTNPMMNGINPAAMFDRLFARAMPVSGRLVKLLATPLSIGLIVLTPMIVSESAV